MNNPLDRSTRPASTEYANSFDSYIQLVPAGDIVSILEAQFNQTTALLATVSEDRSFFRYAPEKWSIKEVMGHMSDAERVMAFRALWFARGDAAPLPGFEENDWVRCAGFDRRPFAELLAEWGHVRQTSIALLNGFDSAAWQRTGVANNNPVSVRALAYIIAGHERHHVDILRARYQV